MSALSDVFLLPTCLKLWKLNVSVLLAGDSPPGLSKEIASALSHVPGFEMDPFSLDDSLRMDPLALDMLEGDLMLADPAVEDSFRSDRLKWPGTPSAPGARWESATRRHPGGSGEDGDQRRSATHSALLHQTVCKASFGRHGEVMVRRTWRSCWSSEWTEGGEVFHQRHLTDNALAMLEVKQNQDASLSRH